jgi:hypothetical protein
VLKEVAVCGRMRSVRRRRDPDPPITRRAESIPDLLTGSDLKVDAPHTYICSIIALSAHPVFY